MKTALIIGGSGGIGEQIVRLFIEKGRRVIFSYCSSEENAKKIADETGALPVFLDMERADSRENFVHTVLRQFPHIDTLVFAQGIAKREALCDNDFETTQKLFSVNLLGPIEMLRLLIENLRRSEASVIFISSIFGLKAGGLEGVYSASKAGLISIMQALNAEESALRANAVCPGAVDTKMLSQVPKEELDMFEKGQILSPEDIAGAVAFVDETPSLRGTVLKIDGGYEY